MDQKNNGNLPALIQEIAWRFGANGLKGECSAGLTHPEYWALHIAREHPESSMQEIAQELGFTKSGTSRVIDRLEKKGLVRRIKSPQDGRVCCVEVTRSGKMRVESVMQENESRIAGVLSKIDPAMQQVIGVSMWSFVQAFREEDKFINKIDDGTQTIK